MVVFERIASMRTDAFLECRVEEAKYVDNILSAYDRNDDLQTLRHVKFLNSCVSKCQAQIQQILEASSRSPAPQEQSWPVTDIQKWSDVIETVAFALYKLDQEEYSSSMWYSMPELTGLVAHEQGLKDANTAGEIVDLCKANLSMKERLWERLLDDPENGDLDKLADLVKYLNLEVEHLCSMKLAAFLFRDDTTFVIDRLMSIFASESLFLSVKNLPEGGEIILSWSTARDSIEALDVGCENAKVWVFAIQALGRLLGQLKHSIE